MSIVNSDHAAEISLAEQVPPWEQMVLKAVHDLRTPLSSMRTTIEVLRMLQAPSEKSAKLLGMLERQVLEISEGLERLATDPQSFLRAARKLE